MNADVVLDRADRELYELVPDRFAVWVAARPDALAVADVHGGRLTYRELDSRSDAVACRLTRLGVGPEVTVALALDVGVDLIAAMLGVLKTGGAYLPLNPADPGDRINWLIEDAGARVVLAGPAEADRFAGGTALVLDLAAIDEQPGLNDGTTSRVHPAALAYLIYTSGSTGRPKGVGISHANLAAYVHQILPVLAVRPGDVFSMVQPATFDSCLTVLYPALVSGATLWVVPADQAMDAGWMAAHFRDARVDYVKITPSHLAALHQAGDAVALMPRRKLVLGGEASDWSWFTELGRLREGCSVINHYGPTETTVGAAVLDDPGQVVSPGVNTPLGPAMRNVTLHVLDDTWYPVGEGQDGELCIGGSTVSRGYLGRPGPSADAFVPDPFTDLPGARLYRTGDRVRRRADGTLEFLGRTDDQVKVRGFRVEPAEAAQVLRRCPGVADAVVVPWRDHRGQYFLAGYVKAATALDVRRVRAHAAEQLPDYLVPASIQFVDSFPLTRHGKLDRAQLPPPVATEPASSPVAPAGTPAERTIAAIFAELLGLSSVGREDGFFALGGHSLLVAKLISRLRAEFEVEVPVRLVFEAPTVAGLAGRLDVDRDRDPVTLPPVRRVPRDGPLPASFGQQRLWFLNQFDLTSALYNTNLAVRMLGTVDPEILRRCVTELVRRHEVLRTRLVPGGDGVIQLIEPAPRIPFEVIDLTVGPDVEREEEARRYFEKYTERPFDLTAEIPIRALYLRLAEDEHLLLLSMHHVATEGPSMLILHRELGIVYQALRDRKKIPLEPVAAQYADYATWQRDVLTGEVWTRQLEYWRQRLAGLPPRVEVCTDHPRPAEVSPAGARVRFDTPEPLADRLRALGAADRATLFMTLFAAFLVVLRELTAQCDVAIGIPVAFRPRPELESTVGYFGNTLVLRNDLDGELTFRELLRQVRETMLAAIAHRDLPFEALVEELAPRRTVGDNPLVNIMLAVVDEERPPVVLDEVTFQAEPVDTGTAGCDLVVLFQLTGDGLAGEIEYRTDLFEAESMTRLAARLTETLESIVDKPDVPIAEFVDPNRVRHTEARDEAEIEAADYAPGEYVAPGTDLERALCALWIELIGNEDIGVVDNFFVVGGHSLMAAQVVQRIKQWYGVIVPLRWCFDQPTVAELSVLVLAGQLTAHGDGAGILNSVVTMRNDND